MAKQEKLSTAYLEGDLAKEVYKTQSRALRSEEQTLREQRTGVEAQLVQRERSKTYLALLKDIFLRFEQTKRDLTLEDRKDFLRAVFKSITVEHGTLKDYELYEPFETLRKEVTQIPQPAIAESVSTPWAKSCISLPTAVRWTAYYRRLLPIFSGLSRTAMLAK